MAQSHQSRTYPSAPTYFTDGSNNGKAGITGPEEGKTLVTPYTSAQWVELVAVITVLVSKDKTPINIVSDSAYVVGITKSIETAKIKHVSSEELFLLFLQLQKPVRSHFFPFLITHIRAHSPLPGPLTFGNSQADLLSLLTPVKLLKPFALSGLFVTLQASHIIQAIVEWAHYAPKNQLLKQKEGIAGKSTPAHLHLALLTLNFFTTDDQKSTPYEKHHSHTPSVQHPQVWWKALEGGPWEGPTPLLTWGQGYGCVSAGQGPRWIPSRYIKPYHEPPICATGDVGSHSEHGDGDRESPKAASGGPPPHQARTTTTHSQAPPVTWGQLKSPSQKSEQKLLHTQTPKTPETMLLAMVALVSCAVTGADADLYWTYVPNPPFARPLTSSSIWTNNSHWFPDPNRGPPNLTQKEPYIIILDDHDSPAIKTKSGRWCSLVEQRSEPAP